MTNPNDPANPVDITYNDGSRSVRVGLTKLEYFAGKAMEGLLRSGWIVQDAIVENSVKIAKALIEELNKEDGTN